MPNSLLITTENAVNRATIFKTSLANTVIRLCQDYVPNVNTNRTTLIGAECNYTGYPTGGFNVTAWTGPGLAPNVSGAILTSPQIIPTPAGNNTQSNNVTAGWFETVGNTPVTLGTFIIQPPITVLAPTDQFPLTIQDIEGVNG